MASLNHRLSHIAAREGVAPQRVRNRFVFQRVLARLTRDPRWVLMSGFGLDLALLIEQDLLASDAYARAVHVVFTERDSDTPSMDLPVPPRAWREPFATLAESIGLGERTLDGALDLACRFYLNALDDKDPR